MNRDSFDQSAPPKPPRSAVSRRGFLGRLGATPLAAAAGTGIPSWQALTSSSGLSGKSAESSRGQLPRRLRAFNVRLRAAAAEAQLPAVEQVSNGDEDRYSNKIGSFSKGLPHNGRGEVNLDAYQRLRDALRSEKPEDFELIPLGSPDPVRQRRLVNPQASMAFDLQGTDSHQLVIPPAPAFASAETAGEMVELYWQALLRDVPFTEYGWSSLATGAVTELSGLSDFRGPKQNGSVTPDTLFRGLTPGDLSGPYISQFLWKAVPFGAQFVEQRMRCTRAGICYGTNLQEWLAMQNGSAPVRAAQYELQRRYPVCGRDLAEWVHMDVLYQAYFNAALILTAPPDPKDDVTGGGMGAPVDPGNPYVSSRTQDGFGTFGMPHWMALLAEVSSRALKAVWFQKWQVHRRPRPEEYGGRVHHMRLSSVFNYPVHAEALHSAAVEMTFRQHGTCLLPLAFPEGSPLHPAYGAGHATVAGACVTIVKAFFDESYVIPDPVVATRDGLSLMPYRGPGWDKMTVGGELNKLAANVGIGRNFAGIHWRTDYSASIRLGEAVAISILRDQKLTYNEASPVFRFTSFDGLPVEV
ncbi:MAG TPA: vanadium-dependent haloperoxidase, partial [Bryobacterales bacterium]|nr:vanadium-dependent haloperoxidase [Bryobacterales bacterium]